MAYIELKSSDSSGYGARHDGSSGSNDGGNRYVEEGILITNTERGNSRQDTSDGWSEDGKQSRNKLKEVLESHIGVISRVGKKKRWIEGCGMAVGVRGRRELERRVVLGLAGAELHARRSRAGAGARRVRLRRDGTAKRHTQDDDLRGYALYTDARQPRYIERGWRHAP